MQSFPLGKVTATSAGTSVTALEPHYSVQQVAELWDLCEDAARAIFRSESGVIKIERPKGRYKRAYTTLRIPLSVLQRVHQRMSAA